MQLTEQDTETIWKAINKNKAILDSQDGWLTRPFDAEMRKALGRIDLEFFAHFYLPDHFSMPSAPFHEEVFDSIESMMNTRGRVNQVIAIFRGAGKSTIDTLALPLWCACYGLRHFIPIISDSYDQAKGQLATIKTEIESNERLLEDFGQLEGDVWQADDIETKNCVKLVALGQGMKFRGRKYRQWRPDLIILDDIEDKKAVQSLIQRQALYQWFMGTVMRAGWADTKVLVIGNKLHWDSLVTRVSKNPLFRAEEYKAVEQFAMNEALWDEWREIITNMSNPQREEEAHEFYLAHEEELLVGAKVAWPEVYPYEQCMKIRVTEGEDVFFTEMQNEPSDPKAKYFRHYGTFKRQPHRNEDGTYEEWLVPWDTNAREGRGGPSGKPPVPLNACRLLAATDPSLGETVGGSQSAIIILAKAPTNQLFVLEVSKQYRLPDQIIKDMVVFMEQYPAIEQWGIETVQFQKFFKQVATTRSMEAGTKIPAVSISSHNNLKVLRIQSLQPELANDYIMLNEDGQEDLKAEIDRFKPTGKEEGYDALDALEMARSLADDITPRDASSITQTQTYEFGRDDLWKMFEREEENIWDMADRLADENERLERDKKEIEEGKKEGDKAKIYYPIYF